MDDDRIIARYALGDGDYDLLTKNEYEDLCRRITADADLLNRLLMYVAQRDAQLQTAEGIHARNSDQWIFPLFAEFHDLLVNYGKQRATRMTTMAINPLMEDVRSGAFFSKE